MIITTSGVDHDRSLFLNLSYGPVTASGNISETLSYWPELVPGYFTAGTTIHSNTDFLFAREARAITPDVTGINTLNIELPKDTGPILSSWCPTSVSGSIYSTAMAATGYVSRDLNFKELIYSTCRQRYWHSATSLGGWSLHSTLPSFSLYTVTIPGESNGFGPIHNPLVFDVRNPSDKWVDFTSVTDLVDGGLVGGRQWACSGTTVFIKTATTNTPPSNLYLSWISGQASLDQEEFAYTTSLGIPIKLGTKETISSVNIQVLSDSSFAVTGSTCPIYSSFPRYVDKLQLDSNVPVVVRYSPTGVYGTTLGVTGAVVSMSLPSSGVAVFRYEAGTKQEKHTAGLYNRDYCVISSTNTLPGFFLGVTPNHPLHSTIRKTILNNGNVPAGSKLLSWASPIDLYPTTAPSTVRVLVIGQDDLPIPRARVYVETSSFLTVNYTQVLTNLNGEATIEVSNLGSYVGPQTLSLYIATSGSIVVDRSEIIFNLKFPDPLSLSDNYKAGSVVIYKSPDSAKSAVKNRTQFYIYRTLADGIPSPYSNNQLTITCKQGVLYNPYNNGTILIGNSGGKSIILQKPLNDLESFDSPLYFEYENTSGFSDDIITAVWSSPNLLPNSYGVYRIRG